MLSSVLLQKKAEKFYQASQDKLCTDDYDGAVKDLQKACQLDPEVRF